MYKLTTPELGLFLKKTVTKQIGSIGGENTSVLNRTVFQERSANMRQMKKETQYTCTKRFHARRDSS